MKTTALWTTVLAVACASPPATQAPPATPAPARAATAEQPQGHHGHHGHSSPTANHRFQDPDRWSKVFDDPERDAWQKPDAVVAALSLNPASVVADLGAGTGYFSIRIARKVPEGKVFAVDIEPKMVAHVEERARHESLTNVAGIVATPNDPKLPMRRGRRAGRRHLSPHRRSHAVLRKSEGEALPRRARSDSRFQEGRSSRRPAGCTQDRTHHGAARDEGRWLSAVSRVERAAVSVRALLRQNLRSIMRACWPEGQSLKPACE